MTLDKALLRSNSTHYLDAKCYAGFKLGLSIITLITSILNKMLLDIAILKVMALIIKTILGLSIMALRKITSLGIAVIGFI
jgi:hypothetical protein